MPNKNTFPSHCNTCANKPRALFEYFDPSHTWVLLDAEEGIVHIHYGKPAVYEDANTVEAKWIHDTVIPFLEKHPNTTFYSIVALDKTDNSEFVSLEALKYYEDMLRHPQNGFVVFYGAGSGSMNFILSSLLMAARVSKKTLVTKTLTNAEEHYQKWKEKNK